MSNIKATATLIAKIKKQAKELSRTTEIAHSDALEQAAIAAGFTSWHEANESQKAANSSNVDDDISNFPVNPKLPAHFFDKRNESRSAKELKEWWDRPFAQVGADGIYVVRCLDGGAWDRPTNYGTAPTLEAAYALGKEKLAKWQRSRRRAHVMFNGFESISVVRMPDHPHADMEILQTFKDQKDAADFIKSLNEPDEEPDDDETIG